MSEQSTYDAVIEEFKKTKSVKLTAQNLKVSLVKVQKILITEGLWKSKTSEVIKMYAEKGMSITEIANAIGKSEKTVLAYLPYQDGGKGYNSSEKSLDADKSDRYRKKIKKAKSNQISVEKAKEEKKRSTHNNRTRVLTINNTETKKENLLDITADELYSKHMNQKPDVLRLTLSFDQKNSSDNLEVLRKYGKVKEDLEREVLVPADITLHALTYVIFRAFGWQNWHAHYYKLPADTFMELNLGHSQPNNHYDDMFWTGHTGDRDLRGIYFKYVEEDFDDEFWDDDYEEDQSIRTWFSKKYTGPYHYGGYSEDYKFVRKIANDSESKEMPDTNGEYSVANMLLERIPVIEVLYPNRLKRDGKIQEKTDKLISKQKRQPEVNLPVNPVSDTIFFCYSAGDWVVSVRCTDCYYILGSIGPKYEALSKRPTRGSLTAMRSFDMDNKETDKALAFMIASVKQKYKPVCIRADGLNVFEDVGGLSGYERFLKTIHDKNNPEAETDLKFAKLAGWTGRMLKPEAIL